MDIDRRNTLHDYFFRFKSYTREELEGMELVEVNFGWDGKFYLSPVPIYKITDKTVMIGSEKSGKHSARLRIIEAGVIRKYGRLIVPKGDVEEFIAFYRKSLTEVYQHEINQLEMRMNEINEGEVIIKEEN